MRDDIGGREDNEERSESARKTRMARGRIRRRNGPRFGGMLDDEEGREVYPLMKATILTKKELKGRREGKGLLEEEGGSDRASRSGSSRVLFLPVVPASWKESGVVGEEGRSRGLNNRARGKGEGEGKDGKERARVRLRTEKKKVRRGDEEEVASHSQVQRSHSQIFPAFSSLDFPCYECLFLM